MNIIQKLSQYVPKEIEGKFMEDMNLYVAFELPDDDSATQVFSVSMRVKSPYVQSPDESYVNPQYNFGTKQYVLEFFGNKKVILRKTESIVANYEWPVVTTDDGKKLPVPSGIPHVLATVENAFESNFLKVDIKLVHGHFVIKINEKVIIDTVDKIPYPGGYTCFTAYEHDLAIDVVKVEETFEKVKIKDFKPTSLYLKGDAPKRVGEITIENFSEAQREFFVEVSGDNQFKIQPLGILPVGETKLEIEIPDNKENCELTIKLFKEGAFKECDSITKNVEPGKKKTFWVAFTAHEDLGYCGWLNKLKEEMSIYLDLAQSLSDKDERYRYMIEHMWWFLGYEEVRLPKQMKKLVDDYIKTGKIEPLMSPSGTHTYWNQFEQIVRSLNFSRREAKDKYDIDSVTAIYSDTNGFSWQAAQAFAKAGGKYLVNCKGPWRYERKPGAENKYYHNEQNTFPYYEPDLRGVSGLYYWVGPNKKDKLLNYTTWSYGGDRKSMFAMYKGYYEYRNFIVEYLDYKKDYPYDDILEPCYTDHLMPNDANVDFVRRFDAKYSYPKFRICTFREYFEHMEANYKDKIPAYTGEIDNIWGDYATIDPESYTKKLSITNGLAFIEKLSIMCKSIGVDLKYPYKELYDLLWRSFEFDEHCWATMLPPSPDNVFNNDVAKKGNISFAYDVFNKVIAEFIEKLSKKIAAEYDGILAINPLSYESSQIITVDVSKIAGAFEIFDGDLKVPYQFIQNGKIIMEVKLEGFSYKFFRVQKSAFAATLNKLEYKENIKIDTDFYTVELKDMSIVSIFDKEQNVELIDKAQKYGFNRLLYVYAENYTSPEIDIYPDTIDNISIEEGEIATVITQTGIEKESKTKIENRIFIYKNIKRIDIKNRIYDVAKLLYEGCMGKYYGDIGNRYMDNFFYSFPFNMPNFNFKVELQGCEADYQKDYIPGGVRDFVMLQNYAKVENNDFSVTLFNKNAPCMHLGEIKYNQFGLINIPKYPHMYSYVVSSRMSGLHTRSIEDCDLTFEFSVISGKPGYEQKMAWELREPIRASYVEAAAWKRVENTDTANIDVKNTDTVNIDAKNTDSENIDAKNTDSENTDLKNKNFLDVDNDNVVITAVKFSEKPGDGIVLRLLNITPETQIVKCKLNFMEARTAKLLSGAEDIIGDMPLMTSNSFELELAGYDYKNVLLKALNKLEKPSDFKALKLGDNNATLIWKGSEREYYVFRSIEKDFKPLQYNIVGQVSTNSFVDSGLKMETDYYYKVCAIDELNNIAICEEELHVKTSNVNISAPAPLKEIRVSVIDMNSLSLTFRTSKEDDIESYEIKRGTKADLSDLKTIDTVIAEPFYLQFYKDTKLSPDTTYYYQVFAVDSAGNRAVSSPVAAKKTPSTDWWIVRSYADKYKG